MQPIISLRSNDGKRISLSIRKKTNGIYGPKMSKQNKKRNESENENENKIVAVFLGVTNM